MTKGGQNLISRLRAASQKTTWKAVGVIVLVATVFAWPAQAVVPDFVWSAVGGIAELLTDALGQLVLLTFEALIWVSSYNGFVTAPAVANGWVIVRDVVNMFFILVLLVMAFGTILGVDNYSYKNRALIKLIIMAVVINFSRTITGLMIDFGQVIMLTFVNGYSQAAGGNLIEMLKIREQVQLRTGGTGVVKPDELAIQSIMGLIMIAVTLAVMVVMVASLVIRIIYLWMLTVLSPLTFFLKAVPGGQASGYYAEWWKMLTQNIITGPVLAFFLWLSLVTVQTSTITEGFDKKTFEPTKTGTGTLLQSFETAHFQQYIIAVGLLLGGLMMAQRIGGAGVGFGKSLVARGQKMATSAGRWVGRKAGAKVYRASGAERVVGTAQNYLAQRKNIADEAMKKKIAGDTAKVQRVAGVAQRGIGHVRNLGRDHWAKEADDATQESAKAKYRVEQKGKQLVLKNKELDELLPSEGLSDDADEKIKAKRKEITDLETSRRKDATTSETMEARAKTMRKAATATKWASRAITVGGIAAGVSGIPILAGAGGATLAAGDLGEAGRADKKASDAYQLEQMNKAREKLKSLSNEEVIGKLSSTEGTNEEKMAAIVEAVNRPNEDGITTQIGEMRQQMGKLGASKEAMRAFEGGVNTGHLSRSLMRPEEIENLINSGRLDTTKLSSESIKELAGAMATSLSAGKYARAIKDDPLKAQAFVSGMQDTLAAPGYAVNSPQAQLLRQMLMKMDKLAPLESAYGSVPPPDPEVVVRNIKSDKEGDEQILNVGAGNILGKELGRTMAREISIAMLGKAAGKAESDKEVKVMEALCQEIRRAVTEAPEVGPERDAALERLAKMREHKILRTFDRTAPTSSPTPPAPTGGGGTPAAGGTGGIVPPPASSSSSASPGVSVAGTPTPTP